MAHLIAFYGPLIAPIPPSITLDHPQLRLMPPSITLDCPLIGSDTSLLEGSTCSTCLLLYLLYLLHLGAQDLRCGRQLLTVCGIETALYIRSRRQLLTVYGVRADDAFHIRHR